MFFQSFQYDFYVTSDFLYNDRYNVLYLTNNNDVEILKNLHLFFVENSNILMQISEYNNNIIESYTSTDQ